MATTTSTTFGSTGIGPIFHFSSEFCLPSTNVNFPSLTFWYKEEYDISEIATSRSLFKCICAGRKFVKELRQLFG